MDRRASFALPAAAAVGLAILGWREFYFLTDDAYIAFRYASNSLAGRGLVWNPPPFLPVEGYTCWLWVVMLRWIWAWTGIAPPDAVGPLSLAFGLGSLGIALRLAARLPLATHGARAALVGLVGLGIVSNRTFLAWLSSGLETALFNFAFTAWFALALSCSHRRSPARLAGLACAAAAAALTRPDGWLAVAGSVAIVGAAWWRDPPVQGRRRAPATRELAALLPLLAPVVHVLWRYSFYDAWLPNTYYAKAVGPWPASGLRYAASFTLEYALWLWLAAATFWAFRAPRRPAPAPLAIGVGVLVAHFSFYTLNIGGDHFEYRVYSHLVPLLFASFPWLLLRGGAAPRQAIAATAVFVALSWPIPWAHHFATRDLETRSETHKLVEPVAPLLPAPFSWVARPFDALQAWLIPRHVGMRHREHVAYLEQLKLHLPSREEGQSIRWDGHPVLAVGNVGLIGWVLPNVAILDMAGLNDYVVARTPPPDDGEVLMAHDRVAPPAYLACFQPNVRLEPGRIEVLERPRPLDDAAIERCETEFRRRADEGSLRADETPS
jgi:arabinofuranosyltransferase